MRDAGAPERVVELVDELERRVGELGRELATEHPRVALERVHAWLDLGRLERALEDIDRIATLADETIRGDVSLARARHAEIAHRMEDALEHLDAAVAADPDLADVALGRRAFLFARRGDDARVIEIVGEFDGIAALEAGRLRPRAALDLVSTTAMSRFRTGDVARARKDLEQALTVARKHDLSGREAGLYLNLAIIARRTGSLVDAAELLRTARAAFRSIGNLAGEAHTAATLGGVLRETGELFEANSELERALDLRGLLADSKGVGAVQACSACCSPNAGTFKLLWRSWARCVPISMPTCPVGSRPT